MFTYILMSFLAFILFVPWLVIVLLPLGALFCGGIYCAFNAKAEKDTTIRNEEARVLDFPRRTITIKEESYPSRSSVKEDDVMHA